MTPPFKNFPLGIRFIFIIGMFLFNTVFFTYAAFISIHFLFGVQSPEGAVQGIFTTDGDRNAFLFVQGIASLAGFVVTAMMFSYLEAGEFSYHLRLNYYPKLKMVALAIFSILVAQFFIDFLVQLNSKIPLPASLGFLKEMQDKNEQVVNNLMNYKGFINFIWVSVVMAVIPALGEEMFFRGLLLGDMLKAKVKPSIAIIFTGLVFAVFHFEFQNTLAIWALGCFLGYLYYVSGSLWLTITVHFTNNFLEVLLKYLYNNHYITMDASNASTPAYATIISIAIFIPCLFIFYKWKRPYALDDELLQDEGITQ